jgi:transposase-like protein
VCPARHPNVLSRTFATIPRHQEIYAAIFIDAIIVKVRDGQVANRPIYAAIGVSLDGERDILGLWAGTGARAPSSG